MKITLLVVLFSVLYLSAAQVAPPLYLSNYLNNPTLGRQLSRVNLTGLGESYSGYFTVNPKTDSNMFFWFLPAQNGNTSAPLLLWLSGGPGFSSLYGLFYENGPVSVSEQFTLVPRNTTWNKEFNIIYIDNPIGAGFSYTNTSAGFSTNQDEIASNLYSTLQQFFDIFTSYRKNDFYVTVESYGGKYGISLTYHIHQMNQNPQNKKINLAGLSIGDGAISPQVQFDGLHELLYYFGFADENEREIGKNYEQQYLKYIQLQQWEDAFHAFDQYINGDFWPFPTFVQNITGLSDYFNILSPVYPPNPFQRYLRRDDVRNQTHVGTYGYEEYNQTSEFYLITDWLQSVEYKLPTLLENYKVLIYNGQIDLILGPSLTENLLRTVKWSGQSQYLSAKKNVWKQNGHVNGWARSVQNFRQVIVRNAGHMVPTDQPDAAVDMITRFVKGLPF